MSIYIYIYTQYIHTYVYMCVCVCLCECVHIHYSQRLEMGNVALGPMFAMTTPILTTDTGG